MVMPGNEKEYDSSLSFLFGKTPGDIPSIGVGLCYA
jgi:hypothetical protein